jgi:hypothetical protein
MTVESFNKERLCNLIRLLSSPVEGEKLAAVYGIERILTAAGLTFHDLAMTVQLSPLLIDGAGQAALSWVDAGYKLLKAGSLTEHEKKFVTDMIERFASNSNFKPSEKQVNWFVVLYKRCVKPREKEGVG